ncbi:MAG: hypothetical protein ACYTHJ_01765 [Planctomycetota bacterium]|jgi:hypothetical protein
MSYARRTIEIAFVLGLATTQIFALQASIEWTDDSEAGVAAARKSALPMLFLVLPPADAPPSVMSKVEASFADPVVTSMVRKRFIAVRLPDSRATPILLDRLNASDAAAGSAVIATPRGGGIDVVAVDDVRDAQRLRKRLAECFAKYQDRVFTDSVKPVLQNENARREDLQEALRLVRTLELTKAADDIATLLNRETLPRGVPTASYDALANLSTKKAVDVLLEKASDDNKAAEALRSCKPAAAVILQPELKQGNGKRLVIVYNALAAICSVDNAKPAEFWQGGDDASQKAEIERVKARVATCGQAAPATPPTKD